MRCIFSLLSLETPHNAIICCDKTGTFVVIGHQNCKAELGFHDKRVRVSGILEKIHRDTGIWVAYCGPSIYTHTCGRAQKLLSVAQWLERRTGITGPQV